MLFSCPLCYKSNFEDVECLKKSLVNVASSPLTCPVCQETLNGLDKFTIHIIGHVNNCASNSDDVDVPVIEKEISVYNDYIKDEIDESINNLRIATKTDTLPSSQQNLCFNENTTENDLIVCDICNFTFTDKSILEFHQKLLHQTPPDEKTGIYSYHCHLCSKRFKMRGSLMIHLRVAHYGFFGKGDGTYHYKVNNNLENLGKTCEDQLKSKCTAKSQEFKQWNCEVCAKMFTTKYFLKKHKRLHTGEMPYTCTICNKCFTFQQSYHKHMLYHSSDKPYMCDECGRSFKEHSTLQNHVRIHSGERPFGCEICGKRFRQRVSFLVHMRIHTGVMPYKCTGCGKSFRYKVSQRSHKCEMNPPGSVIRVGESDNNMPPRSASPKQFNNEDETNLKESNQVQIPTPVHSKLTEPDINNMKDMKYIMAVDYDTGNISFLPDDKLKSGYLDANGATLKNNHMAILNKVKSNEKC